MSDAIHAHYTFDQDQFITAQSYHARLRGRRMRWLRWAYLGISVATVVTIIITQEVISPMLYVVLAFGYIGVLIAEVMQHPKMLARTIKKRFAEGIYQAQEVSFVLKDDAVTSRTNGKYEKHISWTQFEKIVETPDGFLMYLDKQVFLWLPIDALRPAASEDTLRSIWGDRHLVYTRFQ